MSEPLLKKIKVEFDADELASADANLGYAGLEQQTTGYLELPIVETKIVKLENQQFDAVTESDLIGVSGIEWEEDEDDQYDDDNEEKAGDEDGKQPMCRPVLKTLTLNNVTFYCDEDEFVHVFCDQYNHYKNGDRRSRGRSAIGCWFGPNHPA